MQYYFNLEIVVSDNFSCVVTEDIVRDLNDSRIKYINTGIIMSMFQNWEFALTNISDGWVTMLGDDDGLSPGALSKVAVLINKTGVDAIGSKACSFAWPIHSSETPGKLSAFLLSGYELRNSNIWLKRVMHDRAEYPELPMLYSGDFISSGAIHKVKGLSGPFYKSCNPDVFSAIAISFITNSYVYSAEPFAINGALRHSTGTSATKGESSKISPIENFKSENNLALHNSVPMGANATILE